MRFIAAILFGFVAVAPAAAMDMKVAGDQAYLSGRVDVGDAGRFTVLLDQSPVPIKTVILRNSPGGDANTGYVIGDLIRERHLNTAVSGYCRSSCSRMFLGGVERQFTDDYPPGRTHVGFHGNYDGKGFLTPSAVPKLRAWIIAHSDGKADPVLVDRWTEIPTHNGFIYFFDSERLKRSDGISVFLCTGGEHRDNRFNECEKIAGRTGYQLGIFTSSALIHSVERPTD